MGYNWRMFQSFSMQGVCWMNQSDGVECSTKEVSERKVASVIRSLVNARTLQLESARVLHESFLVPVLLYGRRKKN